MSTDCDHEYQLARIEETPQGKPNIAHLKCGLCGHELARITSKTPDQIQAEAPS